MNETTKDLPYLPNDKLDGMDAMMGLGNTRGYLPPMSEIPDEFKRDSNPWCHLVSEWFFKGLKTTPNVKPGIDRHKALRHVAACLRSFEPQHEHKEAGCAYLMSLWFEPIPEHKHKAKSK